MSTLVNYLNEDGFDFGNCLLTVGDRGRYFLTLDTIYLRGEFSPSSFKNTDLTELSLGDMVDLGLESERVAYHEYGHYKFSALTIETNFAFVKNYVASYKLEKILQEKGDENWSDQEVEEVLEWLEDCRDVLKMSSVYWDPIQELFARYTEAVNVEKDTSEMLRRQVNAIEDYEVFQPEEDLFIPPHTPKDRRNIELIHNYYLRQCLGKVQRLVEHFGEDNEVTQLIHFLAMALPNGYTASQFADQDTLFTTIIDFDNALNILLREIVIEENINGISKENDGYLLSRFREQGLARHSLMETKEAVFEELDSIDGELADRFRRDTESITDSNTCSLYIVEPKSQNGVARMYNKEGMSERRITMSMIRSILTESIDQGRDLLSDQPYTDYLQRTNNEGDLQSDFSKAVDFYRYADQNGLI